MTPSSAVSPMTAPPMKCAVIGASMTSPQLPIGRPPMILDSRRMASLATGIHVGFGAPSPCLLRSRNRPDRVRSPNTVTELFTFCMTSAMMSRCDAPRTHIEESTSFGFFHATRAHCLYRGVPSSPSLMTVPSSSIAFEPRP